MLARRPASAPRARTSVGLPISGAATAFGNQHRDTDHGERHDNHRGVRSASARSERIIPIGRSGSVPTTNQHDRARVTASSGGADPAAPRRQVTQVLPEVDQDRAERAEMARDVERTPELLGVPSEKLRGRESDAQSRETGRNSVSPCTTPSSAASRSNTARSSVTRRRGRCGGRLCADRLDGFFHRARRRGRPALCGRSG